MDRMNEQAQLTRIQQKNRSAILTAALDIFSKFGFRGSTLDQIAEASGLSKPNVLYYFKSKEAIYTVLLERQLATWLDPLKALDPKGDPITEILAYTQRKLDLSRDFPRESRLFANEIIQGAPRIGNALSGELKTLVDDVAEVILGWIDAGLIRPIDPHHLIFSIWSMTQHYADFDVQVRAVLDNDDPYPTAAEHLKQLITRILSV